jgi:metallophosphoesterase superfamily enzyme
MRVEMRRMPQVGQSYTDPYTVIMPAERMLRVSDVTHAGFREEALRRGVTIDEVAAAALRALRQKEMGEQLAEPLTDDEVAWLDAPLG